MKVHEQLAALTGGKPSKKKRKAMPEIDFSDPLFLPTINPAALLGKKKQKKKTTKDISKVVAATVTQKKTPKNYSKPATPVAPPKKASTKYVFSVQCFFWS